MPWRWGLTDGGCAEAVRNVLISSEKQQGSSSYNEQQTAHGDAAAAIGAPALRLPAFLVTPTDEA